MTDPSLPASGLRHSLKQRHMTMIAFGGVIGAGLFVGSGVVIQATGPAAVLSFLITGLLVVLIMRMLGEMAAAMRGRRSALSMSMHAWPGATARSWASWQPSCAAGCIGTSG